MSKWLLVHVILNKYNYIIGVQSLWLQIDARMQKKSIYKTGSLI